MSQTAKKKVREPISNKTLNRLLAAAILIMLLPFAYDAFLAVRESQGGDQLQTDPSAVFIRDDAGMLSDEEVSKLQEVMLPVTAYYPVAFSTTEDTGGTSAVRYSEKLYNQLFDSRGGVLFLIDFDTSDSDGRQLYIRVTNRSTKLSTAKCDTIADNIYPYARDGRYYECARRCFSQIYDILDDRPVPQPMKHMSNLLIAVCFALVIVFTRANQKTRIKKPGEVYLLDKNITKKLVLTNASTRLIKRYTVSNSSSGGGGFSGGGGGGFSGGGGGGGSHGGGHGF